MVNAYSRVRQRFLSVQFWLLRQPFFLFISGTLSKRSCARPRPENKPGLRLFGLVMRDNYARRYDFRRRLKGLCHKDIAVLGPF